MTDFIMFTALLWRQEYRLRCKGNLTTDLMKMYLLIIILYFWTHNVVLPLFQNVPFYFTFEVMPLVLVRICYVTLHLHK
jgi:hypothetical protein